MAKIKESKSGDGKGRVKPDVYTKLIKEFRDSDMEEAEIELERSDVIGNHMPDARTISSGMRKNIERSEIEGIKVIKDSNKVYLVREQ